jgi:hypothetical protein
VTPPRRPAPAPLALAAALPLGVATGSLPIPYGDLRWLVLGVVLLAFAISYRTLARRMPGPVVPSGLIARGAGRPLGLGAAALTLVSGAFFQLALYRAAGLLGASLLDDAVAWWVVALGCCAIVAACALLPARLTTWLLVLLIPAGAVLITGSGPPGIGTQVIGSAMVITGDRAPLSADQLGGHQPPTPGDQLGGLIAALQVPAQVVAWVVFAGLVAGLVGVHQLLTRQVVLLGHERVVPAVVGRVPVGVSLAQSVVAGAALGVFGWVGAAPGPWLGRAGGLGIVFVLALTALAALLFLNRDPAGDGVVRRLVAPLLSTVGLGVLGYLALPGVPLLWAGIAVLAGAGYGLALRRTDPVRYAGIGLGVAAVVVTPAPPVVPRQRLPGAHRPERITGEVTGEPAAPRRRRTPGSE